MVYVCPEMLETPTVARVLFSASFQRHLSGVYVDEAHVVYESLSWRPSYTRLHLLRQVLGTDAPMVAMSATLPERYRQALVLFTGLRPEYKFINLGNFRPELSTVVKRMQHSARSFRDLEFVLRLAQDEESVVIYSDDLETLTAMFWWFYQKLTACKLPVSWLNILHAGLSEQHQRLCIAAACDGNVRILLGSDKIGAGMDFPSVSYVIQYQCRGLTLVRWEQQKGRGARCHGLKATGIILVEKSMAGEEKGGPTVKAPKSEDPGLLELIQTDGCLQHCVDNRLENPSRDATLSLCPGCSVCNPDLLTITQSFTFVLENPHKPTSRAPAKAMDWKKVHEDLIKWRKETWEMNWKDEWPGYDIECLVRTTDLQELARRAPAISNIDDIDSIAPIPHLHILGDDLLNAIQASVASHSVQTEDTTRVRSPTPVMTELEVPSHLTWSNPQTLDTFELEERLARERQVIGPLAVGESVVHF